MNNLITTLALALTLLLPVTFGCSKGASSKDIHGAASRRDTKTALKSDGKAKTNETAEKKAASSNAEQVKDITEDDYAKLESSIQTDVTGAAADVPEGELSVAERAVVVVNDSTTIEPPEKQGLYTKIDAGMKLLFNNGLRPGYGKVVFLGRGEPDGEATWENFIAAVSRLAKDPSINRVDAIINVHGSDGATGEDDGVGRAYFIGGAVSADDIAAALVKNVSDDDFYKLGIVYDQSCYGAQHIAGYVKGGFLAAAATIGEHGTGVIDYPTFVRYWGNGSAFSGTLGAQDAVGAVGKVLLGWFSPPPPEENDTWQTAGEPDGISIYTRMLPPTK